MAAGPVAPAETPRTVADSLDLTCSSASPDQRPHPGNQADDAQGHPELEAFIHQVEAQAGKKIPQGDADALIAAAHDIIDLLTE